MHKSSKQLLRDCISINWLRPESGLALASPILNGLPIIPRLGEISADFGCGDGITSFVRCGGRLGKSYDVFMGAAKNLSQQEIVEKGIDVFDYCDESYSVEIIARPETGFTYGTDFKSSHLQKAAVLNFYDNLIEADLNKPAPFAVKLDYAYCNCIYWADSDVAIGHISNAVRSGGRAIFEVWTPYIFDYDFHNIFSRVDKKWCDLLNRNRYECYVGVKAENEWAAVFEKNGFIVHEIKSLSPEPEMSFWNYGLRPIYPVLQRMADALASEFRAEIKEEWVDVWTELLLPLLENPDAFWGSKKNVRPQYILEKK